MSTTEEIMNLLDKQFPGWNRDGERGTRHYLNLVQRVLLNIPADQLMIIDEDTGKLPSFNTVSNTFKYDLPSTVNFIDTVLVEAGANVTLMNNYSMQDYGRFSTRTDNKPFEDINISGIDYYKIPYVRSTPAKENAVASVIFTVNPGTSTDIYRYRGYELPAEIVSDTIQLSIDPPYDMIYLYPATCKVLQGVQNGKFAEAYEYIIENIVPKVHKALNKGAFGINQIPDDHGF